ncbi:MAG: ABC transporter permease subunit [Terrimicrobiaceae bacterium]|nr:ABC transporter permease subunit [Terrimicrobiaceae bacterium]
MTAYIVRRLLLMLPTLLGITLVCFALIQFVPGGPVEEIISKVRAFESARGANAKTISTEEIANIKAYFGFDKPAYIRYFTWLGNLFRGDFGNSYVYQQPGLQVIVSKMPISLFFGLVSFLLSYSISIPLGVKKAMSHGSPGDVASSALIFAGYVIPGYTLGILLIIFFAGGSYFDWFPLGGIVGDNFENLSPIGRALDFLHHMVLPLICYMIGDFAVLTLLMKNNMLEELHKDYVRTAMAKGFSFRDAAWRQAFRNALIPVATGIGSLFAVMFTSSLLIERVFDIDGMGLLFYNSVLGRDYNVVLGIIVLSSFFTMLGRLFSDIVYVAIDPRIRFD